jgi:hypothetical protein
MLRWGGGCRKVSAYLVQHSRFGVAARCPQRHYDFLPRKFALTPPSTGGLTHFPGGYIPSLDAKSVLIVHKPPDPALGAVPSLSKETLPCPTCDTYADARTLNGAMGVVFSRFRETLPSPPCREDAHDDGGAHMNHEDDRRETDDRVTGSLHSWWGMSAPIPVRL